MDFPATPIETAVPGVYLSPAPYERLVEALRRAVERLAPPEAAPALSMPPVIARELLERAGYVRSFPQLVGTVHGFEGSAREWLRLSRLIGGGEWYQAQRITDLALLPAACYPLYPLLAGAVVDEPRQFCVHATCFRQEPTAEPGRLRSFRMSELVYAGPPDSCLRWRDDWLDRAAAWLADLGLETTTELADDPFFGPGDALLRDTQRDQRLKWELRTRLGDGTTQAIASCNSHRDHFGAEFGLTTADGPAHTACTAFGLDRIALALIRTHGADTAHWTGTVRAGLRFPDEEHDDER